MKLDIAKVGLAVGAIGLFYWMFKDSKEAATTPTPAANPPTPATPAPTPLKGFGKHRKHKRSKKKK